MRLRDIEARGDETGSEPFAVHATARVPQFARSALFIVVQEVRE